MNADKKQQIVAAKRRELEEKKKRWMQERQQEDLNPSFNSKIGSSSSSSGNYVSSSGPLRTHSGNSSSRSGEARLQPPGSSDEVLRLTKSQLSDHIRDEIAREIQSQRLSYGVGGNIGTSSSGRHDPPGHYEPIMRQTSVVDEAAQHRNLEQYVMQTEANSHTCKICFELMVSPQRTPMFLYPCGHTFCKDCMGKHTNQGQRHQSAGGAKPCCPYCRTVIQSMVANQAIKELIDGYVEQKAQLLPPIHQRSEQEISTQQYEQYSAVVASCEIRRGVLMEQLAEQEGALENYHRRKRKLEEGK
jgi:hypothetical protein